MIRFATIAIAAFCGVLAIVQSGQAQVYVRAPFVRVEVGGPGTYVRAPFVSLWLPSGQSYVPYNSPGPYAGSGPVAPGVFPPAGAPDGYQQQPGGFQQYPSLVPKLTPLLPPSPTNAGPDPVLPPPQAIPEANDQPLPPPQPLQTKLPTLQEFAKTFQAKAGTYDVTIINPVTNQPAQVHFTLPEGSPRRVIVNRDEIEFRYGPLQWVRIQFDKNGVQVTSR